AAVFGTSTNGGGAGGGWRSRPPVWDDAAELLRTIQTVVSASFPTGMAGTVPACLRALAAKRWAPEQHKQVRTITGIINAWCDNIEALLDGTRARHLVAACPACGVATVEVRDSAGELVRQPALQIVSGQGCTCLACHHCWAPDRYLHLAAVLGC
ncbi:DUF7340 domain-containing protein, partial [Mycolicibacterium insubricum]